MAGKLQTPAPKAVALQGCAAVCRVCCKSQLPPFQHLACKLCLPHAALTVGGHGEVTGQAVSLALDVQVLDGEHEGHHLTAPDLQPGGVT